VRVNVKIWHTTSQKDIQEILEQYVDIVLI